VASNSEFLVEDSERWEEDEEISPFDCPDFVEEGCVLDREK
jgi:hypothetical protein